MLESDLEKLSMALQSLLVEAIKCSPRNRNIGILYSGGLDSSIITKLLEEHYVSEKMVLATVGIEGSYDIVNAITGAQELEFHLNTCLLTPPIVERVVKDIMKLKLVNRVGELSIAVPLYIGFRFLSEKHSTKIIFLGQGADELFGGYMKYVNIYAKSGKKQVRIQMMNDLKALINTQQIMEKKLASLFRIELSYPYLSSQVIKYAQAIPVEKHIEFKSPENVKRKIYLRNLARDIGLSNRIAEQPKKAIQYGSGTNKVLKHIAKEAGFSKLHNWFEFLSEN
jgi:asparagine synthase (glutamine-hydrolysing)